VSAFATDVQDSIAVVTLDLPGEPVNTLTAAVRVEFEALLIRLRDEADIKAVVLISGKPDTFIAGADIEEFTALTTQAEAERLSFEGQEMVSRIETLPKPVVAAIHGACLGGGLELALACHYRVASDHPKTQLGLPEVQLGVIPGAGGTQRLPRLIGLRASLDMILTGKSERAAKALRIGLADEVVPPSILLRTATAAARRLVRDGIPKRNLRRGLQAYFLDHTTAGRSIVYRGAKAEVMKRTGGHYPAPLAALETVRWTSGFDFPEHELTGELVALTTPQTYAIENGRVTSDRGLDVAPGPDVLDPVCDLEVELTPLQPRERAVGDIAGERVLEGELAQAAHDRHRLE